METPPQRKRRKRKRNEPTWLSIPVEIRVKIQEYAHYLAEREKRDRELAFLKTTVHSLHGELFNARRGIQLGMNTSAPPWNTVRFLKVKIANTEKEIKKVQALRDFKVTQLDAVRFDRRASSPEAGLPLCH